MSQNKVTTNVRQVSEQISIIDIQGEVTGTAEDLLMEAYNQAGAVQTLILNFSRLGYMNSSGIGLLVTLLIRANRQGQRLVAVNLSDHYRHIFDLTGLNQAIVIYATEGEALVGLAAMA
ncbi:MAG: STAS domain-containing protein [Anaerolineales bacterium]|nr:STAS domain-containing protein [Anaerolineales bacterium]